MERNKFIAVAVDGQVKEYGDMAKRKLVEVTNVVATKGMISSKMMAAWVENFYKVLRTQPLAMALAFAAKESRAPMHFYGRATTAPKMRFSTSPTAVTNRRKDRGYL